MGDHARDEELVAGELYLLPELPLMLVARIGGLEGVAADVELQEQIDEVAQLQVMHTRRHIGAVAGVKAHAVLWNAAQRMIDDLDLRRNETPAVLDAEIGDDRNAL